MNANRLFTLLAVTSLALGIGANTAIYSFMDAILLRALPVADPQSLVVLNWHAKDVRRGHGFVMHSMSGSSWGTRQTGVTSGMFPYPAFEMLRKSPVFSMVFGHFSPWSARKLNVTVGGQAEIAAGEFVTGDFFNGLGVPPAAGRLIMSDDDRPGAPPVAVISHALSETRFGGPVNAAGRQILIDNLPFTVVGVAPPGFFGVDPAWVPDVYLPTHTNELLGAGSHFGFRSQTYLNPNYYWIQIMGRLRPGVTRQQAQAALAPVFHQWVAGTAANDAERANLPALVLDEGAGGLGGLRREYSQPLYVLMALVGLILAVACANVANLLLARSAARSREMALRLSVGAGRLRLVRQLLTESVLLASLGGIIGLLLAIWGMRFLTLLLANGRVNFTLHAELNWRVLAAAAALSLLTGVLFGLAPALRTTRVDVMPALKEARTGQPRMKHGIARLGLSNVLMTGQIAISLVMLFAAGLFVRTLSNLESVNLGFTRENVLLFQLDARKAGHKDPEISAFYGELRRRFAEIPGVRVASLSDESLIEAGTGLPISLPGQPPRDETRLLTAGPAFFATMQIRILAGRDFDDHDRPGSPAVAIVNEVFAKTNLANRNPLGQRLILHNGRNDQLVARDMEIVGVAANSRYGGLTRDIAPVVYMPYDQGYPEANQMVYALRTAGDPLRYVAAVREAVRRADPLVPVSDIRTQAADIDHTISQEITFARLCSGFGFLALAIASVGLYGTVSYSVARRTGEIGIRMALGAPRGSVLRLVFRQVVALAVVGLAIGAATSLATSKFVESFLYGLKPNDPLTLTAAVLVLLCAALAAAYVPAWKASRIDPAVALRHE
jgi:predicted permease